TNFALLNQLRNLLVMLFDLVDDFYRRSSAKPNQIVRKLAFLLFYSERFRLFFYNEHVAAFAHKPLDQLQRILRNAAHRFFLRKPEYSRCKLLSQPLAHNAVPELIVNDNGERVTLPVRNLGFFQELAAPETRRNKA